MQLVSAGDFIDLFTAVQQKGFQYILKKFHPAGGKRVITAWECIDRDSSDWWLIPKVRERWNRLICGNEKIWFPDYICQKYFYGRKNLRLLSVGCGGGTAEIRFARHDCFECVEGLDISPKIILHASRKVLIEKLNNICFFCADAGRYDFGSKKYDAVLFNSSLHHFSSPEKIILKVKHSLKPEGIIIIHEYVGPNRMQWTGVQLDEANRILAKIPEKFRKRRTTLFPKSKVYRPGLMRVFIADPSEAVRSEEILPSLRRNFAVLEEKNFGGNLLHILLKDIAHHFLQDNPETTSLLDHLFRMEDQFLEKTEKSDFVFAVYQKPNT